MLALALALALRGRAMGPVLRLVLAEALVGRAMGSGLQLARAWARALVQARARTGRLIDLGRRLELRGKHHRRVF